MDTRNIYSGGDLKFLHVDARYSNAIREMKEKPGYIAKEVPFYREREPDFKSFEEMKAVVTGSSKMLDKYLPESLPNYYYTFIENEDPKKRMAVYFMEEVKTEEGKLPSPADLDSLIARSAKMYEDTYSEKIDSGMLPDIEIRNLAYGNTVSDHNSKLYLVDLFPLRRGNPRQIAVLVNSLLKGYAGARLDENLTLAPQSLKFLQSLSGK